MVYSEVMFRGKYLFSERYRIERQGLVAASFSAYQLLAAKIEKLPSWGKYLKDLGLSDEPKLSKADLQREADKAMENVNRIIALGAAKS